MGQWINSFSRSEKGKAIYNTNCPYKVDKKLFIDSDIGLTNVQFLLNSIAYTDTIKKRQLLVVDEAHGLEDSLIEFVAMNFNGPEIEQELEINWMQCNENTKIEDFVKWIATIYRPTLINKFNELKEKIDLQFTTNKVNNTLLYKYDEYDRVICQTNRCLSNFSPRNWVMSVNNDTQTVVLKPIFASDFSMPSLFNFASDKVLLMTGTVLDKNIFCNNLGIKPEDSEFLSLDSSFPKENRPIIFFPVGSMSYKNIDKTLPDMAIAVKELLKEHKNDKGIIHTNNFRIAKYLYNTLKDKRLLIHDASNRQEILDHHTKSKDNTVLISPSMTEGIDLFEDLSRFQIICKVPFPFLGDKYIKEKMNRIKNWYDWQTAKVIMQGCGRSVRSINDTAKTYILDSDFNVFFNRNKNLFPKWWKDSIQNV
jgi:Rad3-related DNA helicase